MTYDKIRSLEDVDHAIGIAKHFLLAFDDGRSKPHWGLITDILELSREFVRKEIASPDLTERLEQIQELLGPGSSRTPRFYPEEKSEYCHQTS